jgi:hypothetical protein
LEKRFSKEWFSQHAVSPLWLDLTGFRPYRNLKLEPIVKELNERYREAAGLTQTPDSLLVWKRTRQVILLPILNRCIQLRCLQLYRDLDTPSYSDTLDRSQEAINSQSSDREQLVQQLQYCFTKSFAYIIENQQKVNTLLEEKSADPSVYLAFRSAEN